MPEPNNQYIDINTGQVYESADRALEAQREKQQEELSKKNPPFIQLYKGVSPKIIQNITREYPIATEIFMFFLDYMDNDNAIAVSQTVIAESIDRTRQTVSKGIKVLVEHGAIGIGKIGNSNVYIINTEMAWQRAYKQRKMAKMKGSFIFGKDENKKMFDKFQEIADRTKTQGKNNVNSLTTRSILPSKHQSQQETEKPLESPNMDDFEYDDTSIPEDVPPWEEE